MIRAVGFDLDGTLLDHRAAAGTAIQAWVAERGLEPEGPVAQTWLELEDRWFPEYLAGRLGFQDQRRQRMRGFLTRLGLPVPEEAVVDGWFGQYLTGYQAAWTVDPHAHDLLGDLRARGVVVGVLTNGQRDQQRAKLSRLGLDALVDVVLTLDDVPAGKPDPSAFAVLVDALGCAAHEIAYVGDDPHADGLGAHQAGLRSLWVDRLGGHSAPEGPRRLTSLAQVADHLD